MPRLYVPIGLPGSGKSTWSRRMLSGTFISTDEIRVELSPSGEYVHNKQINEDVFVIFNARIGVCLGRGDQVIADATNLPRKRRHEVLDVGQRRDAEIHGIVFTNVAQAVARNAQREGLRRVPDGAMLGFVELYERTLQDIKSEPFTTLTYIEHLV